MTEEDLFVEDYDLDDEDEEDSDFIDDTECNDDYSRHISAMFGYDRTRLVIVVIFAVDNVILSEVKQI